MTTVGYGDISAANESEAIILIFGMMIATFTFATIFSTIGNIISENVAEHEEFKKQFIIANRFL